MITIIIIINYLYICMYVCTYKHLLFIIIINKNTYICTYIQYVNKGRVLFNYIAFVLFIYINITFAHIFY